MAIYIYAAILAVMMVGLSLNVSRIRNRHQVMFGTGGHDDLERAMRAHGNFIETAPFALLLIFMAESGGALLSVVHVLGMGLIAARLLHAWGLLSSKVAGRMFGTILTHLVLLAAAAACVWLYFYAPTAD